MTSELAALLKSQLDAGLPGLAGTEAHVRLRLTDALLNEAIVRMLPPDGPLRAAQVHARGDGRIDAALTVSRPAFLPPFHLQVAVERQPILPGDPTVILRISGGAGSLLKIAGRFFDAASRLPSWMHLQDDLVWIELRGLLVEQGQAALLDHLTELRVVPEEGALGVQLAAVVR